MLPRSSLLKLVILTAILAFGSISLVSTTSATTFVAWNADGRNLSVPSNASCIDGLAGTVDTNDKVQGTGSVRLTIVGNVEGTIGCRSPYPPDFNPAGGNGVTGGWLYFRWWMKFDKAYTWGTYSDTKMKTNRILLQGQEPKAIWTLYIGKRGVWVGECIECVKQGNPPRDDASDASLSYDFEPATNSAITSWHEYIIGIKKQSGINNYDGEFHFYIDGQQVGQVTQMRWCTSSNACNTTWETGWGGNMVGPYPQLKGSASDGGYIWVDDLTMDDVWNSNFSSSTSPASTAPTAPSTLLIHTP
jgi:hypothetical protein